MVRVEALAAAVPACAAAWQRALGLLQRHLLGWLLLLLLLLLRGRCLLCCVTLCLPAPLLLQLSVAASVAWPAQPLLAGERVAPPASCLAYTGAGRAALHAAPLRHLLLCPTPAQAPLQHAGIRQRATMLLRQVCASVAQPLPT